MYRLSLLLLAVAFSGCLSEIGEDVGLKDPGPDPWVQPELADATIRPGVAIGDPGFCTANFLFLDSDGSTVYIGTAAHCVSKDLDPNSGTASHGCDKSRYEPYKPGTISVEIEGGQHNALLAYNSWYSMQNNGESSGDACNYNDFALLQLHPADAARAHPAMLGFGGPTGDATNEMFGDIIHTFGATTLRPGADELDARQGVIAEAGTWSHTTYQMTPGLPGDSGSAVIRDDGSAVGVLVTLQVTPTPLGNGVSDLGQVLDYANGAGMDVALLTSPLL